MSIDILVINPNSTAAMTAEIGAVAREHASPGTRIIAVNPTDGPPSIQGASDGEACLPGLFSLFEEQVGSTHYNGVIIACFDDTGVETLKARSSIPVIGIGEAAFHAASMVGRTFSTVTTLSDSVPVIERNIERYGFARRSARVRASEVPVLAVGKETEARIAAEAHRAVREDRCDSIVLGCAGMASLAQKLRRDLNLPVIDGVAVAIGFMEQFARFGLVETD